MTDQKFDKNMDDELLGKRHQYPDNKVPTIKQNATKLGFSKEEIEKLNKLYNLNNCKHLGS